MNSNAQKILFWCFILLLFTAISFAAPPVEVTDYNNYYRDIEDENKSLRKTNEFFAHKKELAPLESPNDEDFALLEEAAREDFPQAMRMLSNELIVRKQLFVAMDKEDQLGGEDEAWAWAWLRLALLRASRIDGTEIGYWKKDFEILKLAVSEDNQELGESFLKTLLEEIPDKRKKVR
ncbi:MAG: hypothetical protein CVV42_20080 [Candidatus Riflebacteria bacterium HGW-Riflebacteria-2]|jgi:hypothetical protein|nr:MAG: hypothetical protein CVV42_20080 [Candidatus Riflebacteria bacterium HGW-Riflebacteria-2]